MKTWKEISTADLIKKLEESDESIIIDSRPIAAYNGWALQGENRGGHIPGAKNIPLQWTHYMDWIEVLEEKNITKDKPLIVYGYNPEESIHMAGKLNSLGFHDVEIYTRFVEEWSADPDLPIDKLPKFKHLVYPEWVNKLIHNGQPPLYKNKDYYSCLFMTNKEKT
jgi:thiosulfate/3-mercaptopyruvate sulfurtransferase